MTEATCLVLYGVTVAGLAPRLLLAQSTAAYAPRLAVAGWFLAVGTVLASWIGAASVLSGVPNLLRVIADAVVGVIAARLLLALVTGVRVARGRRRWQRDTLAVLGRHDPVLGATVVETAEPMVYCLPGNPATVVVTRGARNALTPRQLGAVLAHERAHLTGRHSVALAAAFACARALPWLRLFRETGRQVAQLLEMCADDAAARRYGRRTVATALSALSPGPVPAAAVGAAGGAVLARAARLCRPRPARRLRYGRMLASTVTVAALAAGPYLAAVLPVCPHPLW